MSNLDFNIVFSKSDYFMNFKNEKASNVKLISGTSNIGLSKKISEVLNIPLSKILLEKFSDGETRVEIQESLRGKDVIIIQSTCYPANDNIFEMLAISDAAKRCGAKSIITIIPYYGYSRQDRRPKFTRTPISSKLVADMLSIVDICHVVVVDIHSEQQEGFFKMPFSNISFLPIIEEDLHESGYDKKDFVVVSPDAGGVTRARRVAKEFDADIAIIDKRRPEPNVSSIMNVIGDVNGKECIIVDDIIDTAGTLCNAADELKKRGAISVKAYCTHPVLSGKAYERIAKSSLDELIVSDTIPLKEQLSNIRVLSVANSLADTIVRLKMGSSIRDLI